MHREGTRPLEPELVTRALEQLQEGIAVPRRSVAELRSLRERASQPRELAARQQHLAQLVVAGGEGTERGDDPGRSVAPLRPYRLRNAARRLEAGRPLAQGVLALREGDEAREAPPLELGEPHGVEKASLREREDDSGKPMGGTDVVRGPLGPGKALLPELAVPVGKEVHGGLLPRLTPFLGACALVEDPRSDHRPGPSPHQLARRVPDIRAHCSEEALLLPRRRCERVRDEEDARLAHQKRRHGAVYILRKVVVLQIALVKALCYGRPVAPELGDSPALEVVQCPDHARGPEVERRHPREGPVDQVERVRWPELVLVECGLGLRDDCPDRLANPALVPGSLRQRLVARWVEQHGATIQPCPAARRGESFTEG